MVKKLFTVLLMTCFFGQSSIIPATACLSAPPLRTTECCVSQEEIQILQAEIAELQAGYADLSEKEIRLEMLRLVDLCRRRVDQDLQGAKQPEGFIRLINTVLDQTARAAKESPDNGTITLNLGNHLVTLNYLVSLVATVAVYGVAASPCIALIQLHDLSAIAVWLVVFSLNGKTFGEILVQLLLFLPPIVTVFALTLIDYPVCALESPDKLMAALASDLMLWLSALFDQDTTPEA